MDKELGKVNKTNLKRNNVELSNRVFNVYSEEETHKLVTSGIRLLADVVSPTLGADGKLVIYRDIKGNTNLTKDGVSVARNVKSDNPVKQYGIELLREYSEKSLKENGDGTTSTVVVAEALIRELNLLKDKFKVDKIISVLDSKLDEIIDIVKKYSKDVKANNDLLQEVASIAANDSAIGFNIMEILKEIGIYGTIEVGFSDQVADTGYEVYKGYKVKTGLIDPTFMNDKEHRQWRTEKTQVLLFNGTLSTHEELVNIIEAYNRIEDKGHLLIICNDYTDLVYQQMVQLYRGLSGRINVCKNNYFGYNKVNVYEDLAAFLNCKVYNPRNYNIDLRFGVANSIEMTRDYTIIQKEDNDKIRKERVKERLSTIVMNNNTPELDIERYSMLQGGISKIFVGGRTVQEAIELKDRVDDAVGAVKSACKEGVCYGGGYTYLKVYDEITFGNKKDEIMIIQAIKNSCLSIIKTLCKNSQLDAYECIEKTRAGTPMDLVTKQYIELENYKVYDSTSVILDTFKNAFSFAKLYLKISRALKN